MTDQLNGETTRRTLSILCTFTMDRPELGVSEISRRVRLPRSTVHRLLKVMEEEGFIRQDPVTARYRLGVRLFSLGAIAQSTMDLKHIAQPIMNRLRDLCHETVNLYVLDGHERVCLVNSESPHLLRQMVRLGERIPSYCGAAGKVLLAWQDTEVIEEIIRITGLAPLTPNTITCREAYIEELKAIRERGYGVSHGERDEGLSAVAAPVFDHRARILGSLAVSGPKSRFVLSEEIIGHVRRSAEHISMEMGFTASHSAPKTSTGLK